MPRTKVSKQAAATKRIRVSAMEESRLAALHSLDTYAQAFVDQENLKLETNLDLINDLFRGVMGRIPERIKNMTLGDYERFGAEPTDFSNVSSASALANSTTTAAELSKKNKTSCRSDDGKIITLNFLLVFWFYFFNFNNIIWVLVAPYGLHIQFNALHFT